MDQMLFNGLNGLAQALYDAKAANILVLDVSEVCTLTDTFVIAEGASERHVRSLSRKVHDWFKQHGDYPIHTEGTKEGDWIVQDYSTIIVHLFTSETREHYRLEEVWSEGDVVPVKINVDSA
jgi:ribosome-associated protein